MAAMSEGVDEVCLNFLLDQFPYGVVLSDKKRRITWVNRSFSQMCGYALNDLSGMSPANILQGEKTDPMTSLKMKEALDANRACHVQILNYHKNGSTYWADIFIYPVHGASGEVNCYLAVSRDITQEREQREGVEAYLMTLYERLSQSMGHPVPR